ncbi:MAG: DUF6503 family protein [Saprospiraceae bacterium]
MNHFTSLAIIFLALFLLTSANFKVDKSIGVQTIIDKSIRVHGGDKVANGHFSFDFRKHSFTYKRKAGKYIYTRTHKETGIKDILTNEGIKRMDGSQEVVLSEKQKKGYSNSVNSVQYFAFLPYFLNDEAVNKELIGESEIKGKYYYKIKVTFEQEGGGDDHEDTYMYWIDKEDFSLDYLAYSYLINGGGVRFRAAYNTRIVDGVTFQDYINYKHDKTTPVESLDVLYANNDLKELSKIVLENVKSL